jgi:hypothetical protein
MTASSICTGNWKRVEVANCRQGGLYAGKSSAAATQRSMSCCLHSQVALCSGAGCSSCKGSQTRSSWLLVSVFVY